MRTLDQMLVSGGAQADGTKLLRHHVYILDLVGWIQDFDHTYAPSSHLMA